MCVEAHICILPGESRSLYCQVYMCVIREQEKRNVSDYIDSGQFLLFFLCKKHNSFIEVRLTCHEVHLFKMYK